MKKIVRIVIIIIIICVIGSGAYYAIPRKVNLTYDGIRYRIGDQLQEEKVLISINGIYKKRFHNTDFFKGHITVDKVVLDATKNETGLFIGGPSRMIGYKDKENRTFVYGEIFVGNNFDTLTICVQEKLQGWNSDTGIMISAPAKNRIDGLQISNELMKNVLDKSLR